MTRLLVVDSDSGFTRVLTNRLEAMGWEHRVVPTLPPVEEIVTLRLSALVVDPAVLGPRAWDFLERVGGALPAMGVVVCAGRSSVAERVRGLRLFADDWITKPCHPEEVVARVEAVVRRHRRAAAPTAAGALSAGELAIRADQFQAFVGARSADLTRREFELLHLLAEGHGQVLEREEIYRRVWGYQMARGDRSVDVFVRKVRSKLKALSPGWSYIHTHFGIGYRFQPEPPDGDPANAPKRPDAETTGSASSAESGRAPEDRAPRLAV